jgi:hypothetical protein
MEVSMDREKEIEMIAYNIWQQENCPHGRDCEHWIQAELIWERQQKPQTSVIKKKSKAKKNSKVTGKNAK